MKMTNSAPRKTPGDRETYCVFNSEYRSLSRKDLEFVVSRIGVAAIGVVANHASKIRIALGGQKSNSAAQGPAAFPRKNKRSSLEDFIKNDEVLSSLAQAYWGIRITLSDYLPPRPKDDKWKIQTEIRETLCALYPHFVQGKGESFVKEHTNNLMALAMCDSETVRLTGPPLFFGSIKRRINLRLVRAKQGHKRALEFFYTLQQTKRVWNRLPEDLKDAAFKKHSMALGEERPPLTKKAAEALKIALDEVIPPGTLYRRSTVCPTYAACHEYGRADGGNRNFSVGSQEERLISNLAYEQPDGQAERVIPRFIPGYSRVQSSEQIDYCWNQCVATMGLPSDPRRAFDEISSKLDTFTYDVDIVAIAEPGKYRILSKGPGALYTGVRGLQGFLLDAWKVTRYSTMTEELDSLVEDRYRDVDLDHFTDILSGDYSAATDNLHRDVGRLLINWIIERLCLTGTKEGCMALLNFCSCTLVYPDGSRTFMKNGQLMGCPLSFPLLCIANLSTAFRLDPKILPHLLINGDDIAFPSNPDIFSDWVEASEDLGLKRSPGKNYNSPIQKRKGKMQINSRLYLLKFGRPIRRSIADQLEVFLDDQYDLWGGPWLSAFEQEVSSERVGYANYALAIGHRVKSDPTVTIGAATRTVEKLTEFIKEKIARRLMHMFMLENRELFRLGKMIGKDMFVPNWFIPRGLGGLGIDPKWSDKSYITPIQKKVASFLSRNALEGWLVEQTSSMPGAVKMALKSFRRIVPELQHRMQYGPIEYSRSTAYLERVLSTALSVYQWEAGSIGEESVHKVVLDPRQIARQPLMTSRKIMKWVPHYELALGWRVVEQEHYVDIVCSDLLEIGNVFDGELPISK